MHPLAALALVATLVVATTLGGAVWRARQGRIRRMVAQPDAALLQDVGLAPGATLVQFSSEYCAPCRATARLLHELADARADLAHVELDIAERPELAARFGILQTPTTLVLDGDGRVRARIGGAVRRDLLDAELDRLLGAPASAPSPVAA